MGGILFFLQAFPAGALRSETARVILTDIGLSVFVMNGLICAVSIC